MGKPALLRKPLGKREAQLIIRMKKIGKLPVRTISKVTQRNKTTIYNVLDGQAAFAKRGPKPKLDKKAITHLVRTASDGERGDT